MIRTFSLVAFVTSSLVLAQTVPGSITFNARLSDTAGAAITGSHAMGFGLYDTGSGGAALWTENISGASFSTEGVAFIELGAVTPLTTSALDGRKLYLEVSVDGTTLSPRLAIVSVPYAIRASIAATALSVGTLTEASIQRRITGTCNAGQAVRSVDASGGVQCENLATGGGDITAVTTAAGSGLTGGSATGDVALSLTTCPNGEVLKSNGTGWACSASTGVTTSGGLTVTNNNLGLQPCATGEVLKYNGTAWACAADAAGGANGRNLFTFGSTVADWGTPTFTGSPFSITANVTDSQEGDASFDFAYGDVASSTGIVAVWGSGFIPVDPSRTYEGRIKARSASTTFLGSFWAGFIAYSAAKTPLQGPSSIFLSGPTRCIPFIANNVPNTSLSATWQQFVGRVTGEGVTNNQFPVGTRYIKPCVGTNLAGIGTTRIDSFEIFETTGLVNRAQRSWANGTTQGPGAWVTVTNSAINMTTTGGDLLVSMNLSMNGGSHSTCRTIVDGQWAGSFGGLPNSGDPFWQEGLNYTGAAAGGWHAWATTRLYPNIPAGPHLLQIQCATDGATLGVCNSPSVACYWSVLEVR